MRKFGFCQVILSVILLLSIVIEVGCNRHPITEKRVNIVFRFDDIKDGSSLVMETSIIDIFRKNKASLLIGVIPCEDDPSPCIPFRSEKLDLLRSSCEAGFIEIALHGYSHRSINGNDKNELAGLDYFGQLKKISKGREILERMIGVPVRVFIPPWNEYDLYTLEALEASNFSGISASAWGISSENSKLQHVPATCDLSQLRHALQTARSSADTQTIIVVLFHLYDFIEIDKKRGQISLQELSDILEWIRLQEDVRILSFSQATTMIKEFGNDRLLFNKRINSASKLLPFSIGSKYHGIYFQSSNVLLEVWLSIVFFYLAIVILTTLASFMFGYLAFPKSARLASICLYGSLVVLVIIISYALHDLKIGSIGIMAISAAVGLCIGQWSSFSYCRKKGLLGRSNVRKV